jgi:DNA polymerase-2
LADELNDDTVRCRGRELCARINEALRNHICDTWQMESHLELEFEKQYRRLLLPPMRHGTGGRAKGYAGLLPSGEVEIVGMEAVRRDWTPMAHALQRQLLELLFQDRAGAAIEAHVVGWIEALRRGEMDDELVYRKNLRKPVAAYTRQIPPHVRAAKLMKNPAGVISYVMTVQGPQPVNQINAMLDYEHYIKTQIEPLLRTLAAVVPIDVDSAVRGVLDLFPPALKEG